MPPFPDPADLTPAERTRAIARLLAAGLLRLAENPPVVPEMPAALGQRILSELSLNSLELPAKTRLNGHTG
jgi:hypothetical protein